MKNRTGLSERERAGFRTGKQLGQAGATARGALGRGGREGPAGPAQACGLRSRRSPGKQRVTALPATVDCEEGGLESKAAQRLCTGAGEGSRGRAGGAEAARQQVEAEVRLLDGGTAVLSLKRGPQEEEQASEWGLPGEPQVPAEHLRPGIGSWQF